MTPERWRHITDVFHAALAHDASARARYLNEACAADPALRAEVDAMLAAHATGGNDAALHLRAPSASGPPLEAGRMIGSYRIEHLIGAGGMGEVYRARDTKLQRDVAVKVLPAPSVSDPDRLARFDREARALAALNHPNIAAIYGIEEGPAEAGHSVRGLVLELVEGDTLADRIACGPMPLDEAIPIARQIADALEAAHERHIIHRDLKPANIKINSVGAVKVLDFGLAKICAPDSAGSDGVHAPTITAGTGEGIILGTAAYMSPEQARGQAVDKRTDIWAFGCVLFEMLTGVQTFTGQSASETLAVVIRDEPDWRVLPADTPPGVQRLLHRCLQKDVRDRLRDIGDARIEIQEAQQNRDADVAPTPAVRQRERMAWTLFAIATLALIAVIVGAIPGAQRATPESVVTRLDVATAPTNDVFSFALSPDGRRVVFIANGEKSPLLWLRPLDKVTAQPLSGTEGASFPFWAPDGRAIGFFADGKLKRISAAGGAVQVLADAPIARGGTWNPDGIIVFAPTGVQPLMRVAATGGLVTPVTRLAAGQSSHRWPQFLPDGRRFLFLAALGPEETRGVYVGSLDGGEPTRVMSAEAAAVYAPPGYLLLASQGVLSAFPFDAARAIVTGDPFPVAHSVGNDNGAFHSAFSVSESGVLAYRAGTGSRRQLVWVERTGRLSGAVSEPDEYALSNPDLAPDDRRVAASRTMQGNIDVWLIDARRGVSGRFTFDPAIDNSPLWSPDGSQIVFRSSRKGVHDLFVKPANGTTDEQPLLVTPHGKLPLDWSRDGRFVLFSTQGPKTASDLWVLPVIGERTPFALAQSGADEIQGQLSPDGQWLAYASDESGRYEIYIRGFPERGGKWQASTAGGMQPRWRPDGRELFYIAQDAQLMAVPLVVTPDTHALQPGAPVALFPTRLAAGVNVATSGFQARAQYAVGRDGRFLMNIEADEVVTSPIAVMLNWTASLKE